MVFAEEKGKRIISWFLILLMLFFGFNFTGKAAENPVINTTEDLSIERVHPIHKDLLNVLIKMKEVTFEAKTESFADMLNNYEPSDKYTTKVRLKSILAAVGEIQNSYSNPSDGKMVNIFEVVSELISKLDMQDIRSSRNSNFIVKSAICVTDRNGIKITGETNSKNIEEIKKNWKSIVSVNNTLSDFQNEIVKLISKLDLIKGNAINKEDFKLDKTAKPLLLDLYDIIDKKETLFNELINNTEKFFNVYYNSNLEYNNLRFPFYKNSYCSIYDQKGNYSKKHIQIQCALKIADAKNNEAKEKLQNALFLNNQFTDSVNYPDCQGGGFFSRENIRINFNKEDASLGIKSINFYEINSSGKPGKANEIPNYSINTKNIQYDKTINPGFIVLDRTSLLADYPVGMRPVKVRLEIVFNKKDSTGKADIKRTTDTVFVPAYDEGEQISGEDMMYINSLRINEFKHPLKKSDFKDVSTDKNSIYYPRPGGYLLELDGNDNIKSAAYITGFNEKDNRKLDIKYMEGFDWKSNRLQEMTTTISQKTFFGGGLSVEGRGIKFTLFSMMPREDLNEALLKNVKEKIKTENSQNNNVMDDKEVCKSLVETANIDGKDYKLQKVSFGKNSPDLNTRDKRSIYALAVENAFTRYKSNRNSQSMNQDEIYNEYLNYILLSIYDSNNILGYTPGTNYSELIAKLRETKIGMKLENNLSYEKLESGNDETLMRALASACFPDEVKKLKMMPGSGSSEEKYWKLPIAGNILSFDLPEEIVFDEPRNSDQYLMWNMAKSAKIAVYIENKVEDNKTWHYIATSKEKMDKMKSLTQDLLLIKEDSGICEYKISDRLFWQLLSRNNETELSATWYLNLAICPLKELGYLRYRQFPYYYYTSLKGTGEVLVDPSWKKDNLEYLDLGISNLKIPVNKSVIEQFNNIKPQLASKNALYINKNDTVYSPRFIDKDPNKGLDNHAFGIAVNMDWKHPGQNTGKKYFFEKLFIESPKATGYTNWQMVKNVFYKNGFIYGGFHGVNSETSIEPNHIEVGTLTKPPVKYLQNGVIISDADVNEYKLKIDRRSTVKISLSSLSGEYDMFLYKQDGKSETLVAYSTCGIPDSKSDDKDNKTQKLQDINDYLLKYFGTKDTGTYILRVLGYSKKLSKDKYILDVDIKDLGDTEDSPSILNKTVSEPETGTYKRCDMDEFDLSNYYKDILNDIKNDKDNEFENRKYTFEGYASGSGNKWLWPLASTNNSFKNWPLYIDPPPQPHKGVDFAKYNDVGRMVRAVSDGKVRVSRTYIPQTQTFQYEVAVDHDNSGMSTSYVHLIQNSIMVKPGQHVKKGDIIGLVGNTGHSTGVHLHYGVNYCFAGLKAINLDPLNRNLFNSMYDSDSQLPGPGSYNGDTSKVVELLKGSYYDPEDFIYETCTNYDNLLEIRKEIRNRRDQLLEYIRKIREKNPQYFSLPENIPGYYEYKDIPEVQVTASSDGVELNIGDGTKGNYAVSAFLIATGKTTGKGMELVRKYKRHYVADYMKFRDKTDGGAYVIEWPKGEKYERLEKDKNKFDYVLKVEVENIDTGSSYFFEGNGDNGLIVNQLLFDNVKSTNEEGEK